VQELEEMKSLEQELVEKKSSVQASGQCVPHPVSSDGDACSSGHVQWIVLGNVDMPGSNMANGGGYSIDSCQNWCLTTPGCKSAVMTSDGTGVCVLKNAVPATVNVKDAIAMTFTCCVGANTPCSQHASQSDGNTCSSGNVFWILQNNVDIPGSDMKIVKGQSVESCQDLCFDTTGCVSAVLAKDGAGSCYVKNTVPASNANNIAIAMTFACCGSQQCVPHPVSSLGVTCSSGLVHWTVNPNIDIPGSDIKCVPGYTTTSCQALCLSTSGCMAAILANNDAGTCCLKNKIPPPVAGNAANSMTFACCEGEAQSQPDPAPKPGLPKPNYEP